MEKIEFMKKKLDEYMEEHDIPEHMREGISNYVMYGIPAGGFLFSLLTNKLVETFLRADGINKEKISDYVSFIYNCLPAGCWGNEEAYKEWIELKGFSRLNKA